MNAPATAVASEPRTQEQIDWVASIPFFLVHAACLGAIWTGVSWTAVGVCIGLYYFRMAALTIGYHRYFSHRSFKTGRAFGFVLGLLGTLCVQKGPLWWAAHHRHHHRESDQVGDVHSPVQRGFWWSHAGWILCRKYNATRYEAIKDFARFPELVWLNRYPVVPPVLLGAGIWFFFGWQMLVVGYLWSTVLLWHGTFTINSLSHVFGRRRYKTTDTSRNNWLLALITCGEGWHNNHHYHQNTANQGWFWWELDPSYYLLKVLSWMRVVKDLRTPSEGIRRAYLKYTAEERAQLRRGGLVLNPSGRLLEQGRTRIREAFAKASSTRLSPAARAPALERRQS